MIFQISEDTAAKLDKFRDDRKWGKHHTPANLTRALAIEAAELSECYLWGVEPRTKDDMKNATKEVADVAIYLYYYCQMVGLTLDKAVNMAIEINERNYPQENGDAPTRTK